MASIRKNGDKWRVQIRKTGEKSISKQFKTKAEAERWARDMESQMDRGEYSAPAVITVSELVKSYRTIRENSPKPVGDTSSEHYMLKTIVRLLGNEVVQKMGVDVLVKYAQDRTKEGAGPYTINMEVSKIGTVMRNVAAINRLALPDVVGMARPALHHLQLIGGGGVRERRPTEDELFRIKEWLSKQKQSPIKLAMPDMIDVSALIALRRGEILRITWSDLDVEGKTILVRDRKDPRKKKGNDQHVPLVGNSLEIILCQPRKKERIFPFDPGSISKYFKEACDALNIVDLHWHDLRHEAASNLADASWTPHEIRAVTGHKKSAHLDRYVNIDPQRIARKPIVKPVKE